MKKTDRKYDFKKLPLTYEGLVRILPPRPIVDRIDFDNAYEMVEALAGHDLCADQSDYLEAISIFIDLYEGSTSEIGKRKTTPLEALKYLLEENGMGASDLGRLLGSRSLGSAILTGKRGLSKSHILKLAKRFSVSPDLFLK